MLSTLPMFDQTKPSDTPPLAPPPPVPPPPEPLAPPLLPPEPAAPPEPLPVMMTVVWPHAMTESAQPHSASTEADETNRAESAMT